CRSQQYPPSCPPLHTDRQNCRLGGAPSTTSIAVIHDARRTMLFRVSSTDGSEPLHSRVTPRTNSRSRQSIKYKLVRWRAFHMLIIASPWTRPQSVQRCEQCSTK